MEAAAPGQGGVMARRLWLGEALVRDLSCTALVLSAFGLLMLARKVGTP